ncbi:MAG: helix-turn-helix domain-containing protein [Sphingobacteriales bacterium]|nr:MAG: helix-turn-helix domain-containing protein [Sphingobacteriales bacterium]
MGSYGNGTLCLFQFFTCLASIYCNISHSFFNSKKQITFRVFNWNLMNRNSGQSTQPVTLPHPNQLLVIETLDYSNPYDFHKMHRHDYFEIILVNEGEGEQVIDFSDYSMKSGQIFSVYPGQVHLMNRHSANGLLIQFRKEIFEFLHPLKHFHLYFSHPCFTPDAPFFDHLFGTTEQMRQLLRQTSLTSISIYKVYSYLQIVLISLIEQYQLHVNDQHHLIITHFLSLLTQQISNRKKVSEYAEMMNCSTDKLNKACKDTLGKNALEIIHEALMLEIRRLLLLNSHSQKEIAYELNFDSPQNFSAFVKSLQQDV